MNLNFIFLIIAYLIIVLIVLSGILTLINRPKLKRIFNFLENKHYLKFYGKNCYYTAAGQRKNYPSYPWKLEIYLTENEIFFIAKNIFPFIFKSIGNPFALSDQPFKTQSELSLSRIFKPIKISVNENNLNFEFIDNIMFNTNIEYQIELETSKDWEKLKILNNWITK